MCSLCGNPEHEATGSMKFGATGDTDRGSVATSGEMLALQGFTYVHFFEFVNSFGENAKAEYDAFTAAVSRAAVSEV